MHLICQCYKSLEIILGVYFEALFCAALNAAGARVRGGNLFVLGNAYDMRLERLVPLYPRPL